MFDYVSFIHMCGNMQFSEAVTKTLGQGLHHYSCVSSAKLQYCFLETNFQFDPIMIDTFTLFLLVDILFISLF